MATRRIAEMVLPEFDREMALTRRFLERVPEEKFAWRPHPKSAPLGELAAHLARLPWWGSVVVLQDSFDFSPPGAKDEPPEPEPTTRRELLEIFDRRVAETRAAIAGAEDEQLQETWTLLNGGETIFAMPRAAVLRSSFLNHNVHHRAQLGVYLRLNDVPLPGSYGPSADSGAG